MYSIVFSKKAFKDRQRLKRSNLEETTKLLLNKISLDPFCYPPSYEKLSIRSKNIYSRRINRQHRLVYMVNSDKKEVYIIRMWTHYESIK